MTETEWSDWTADSPNIRKGETCWVSQTECPKCENNVTTNGTYEWCNDCGISREKA